MSCLFGISCHVYLVFYVMFTDARKPMMFTLSADDIYPIKPHVASGDNPETKKYTIIILTVCEWLTRRTILISFFFLLFFLKKT